MLGWQRKRNKRDHKWNLSSSKCAGKDELYLTRHIAHVHPPPRPRTWSCGTPSVQRWEGTGLSWQHRGGVIRAGLSQRARKQWTSPGPLLMYECTSDPLQMLQTELLGSRECVPLYSESTESNSLPAYSRHSINIRLGWMRLDWIGMDWVELG